MNILIDENIPYANLLFKHLGNVNTISGREITTFTVAPVDALMVRSVTRINKALLNNTKVKFVGTATAGIDHVDKDWLLKAGIGFSSAPGCNAIAVVEYVFSALLWLAQRDNFKLRDKIIGIVGVGNVGKHLKQRLNAFGIHTMLCDPLEVEAGTSGNWYSLETLVAEADILTFHTPLTYTGQHATWHLVDEALLTAIPSNRIIINTCRGSVIDNTALLKVLENGKPLSVVLDVWENEPLLSLPLLAHVDIGTAHIAGYTFEGKARGAIQIFNAYSAYIGNTKRANLSHFLPLPSVERIRMYGSINEEKLRLLTYLVYDVRYDDIKLRRNAKMSGGFDLLRKYYYPRREWSSLIVEIDNEINMDILKQLGFQAQLFAK